MSSAELKSTLHKLIVETDDVNILAKIKDIFYALKSGQDWTKSISEEERKMIEIGLKQAEDGKLTPHEEVRKKIDQWINEKRT